jgi:16S rRNA (guanine527-N7)-methyltransferase
VVNDDSQNAASDAGATAPTDTLAAALARHGIELPDEQIVALDRYCQRLWDWNTRLNLTRHTDYEKFVGRDVVDSQWLERFLESGERVLDVGTGGGVPGVVLAIVRPDLDVSLCESVAKKAKAVTAIVAEAGLQIPVHHVAAQDLVQRERFDTLVIRAVAPLSKLLTWFKPHWDQIGRLLVIKGPAWLEERAAARERRLFAGLRLSKLATYPMPGTNSESVVLQIRPAED